MGIIRKGPPEELIIKIRDKFNVSQFVETGTYHGDTTRWAAGNFSKVITIEYSKEIFDSVLKDGKHDENIEYLYGDSRAILKTIFQRIEGPAIFWLDSHWSGGETYGKGDECPLVDEINIINSSGKEHFLMIDDARLFMAPPPMPHDCNQWPSIDTVLDAIKSGKQSYYIVISEDVIIAVPSYAKELLQNYCQEGNKIAGKRYSESEKKDRSGIKRGLSLIREGLKLIFKI